jgi:Brp/Blh family beta-carotene 15,15'-monooxygenase
VFLLTIVGLGLPHGAVDHLCLARAHEKPLTGQTLGAVGLLYLSLGSLYAVAWFLAPVAGFVFFILLTWFHWGQGDLYPLTTNWRGYPHGRVGTALTLAVRGGIPMLVPLVFFPDRYQAVATILVGLVEPSSESMLAPAFTPAARLTVAGLIGSLTLASLVWGYWHAGGTHGWRTDVAETTILWLFFATVPPVLAIGLYFSLWHSVRHIFRVLELDPSKADGRSLGAYLRQFCYDAAPLSAGALLCFALLFVALPYSSGDVSSIAGTYLVLLAVLTLPHVVVVTWLDFHQRLWAGSALRE